MEQIVKQFLCQTGGRLNSMDPVGAVLFGGLRMENCRNRNNNTYIGASEEQCSANVQETRILRNKQTDTLIFQHTYTLIRLMNQTAK